MIVDGFYKHGLLQHMEKGLSTVALTLFHSLVSSFYLLPPHLLSLPFPCLVSLSSLPQVLCCAAIHCKQKLDFLAMRLFLYLLFSHTICYMVIPVIGCMFLVERVCKVDKTMLMRVCERHKMKHSPFFYGGVVETYHFIF